MNSKLFKYRGVSNDLLKRDIASLKLSYFYSPQASQLNDPAETVVKDFMTSQVSSLPSEGIKKSARDVMSLRETYGIFSLSRTSTDELMWAYYAEGHIGYCIEYDVARLTLEARSQWEVMEVAYSREPPEFSLEDVLSSGKEFAKKLLATKSERWSHENETRILTARSGINYHSPSAVTAIYFGLHCKTDTETRLRQALAGRAVRYHRTYLPADSYGIESRQLDHDQNLDGETVEFLAPVDSDAIPNPEALGKHAGKHTRLLSFVEKVRRDPGCKKVVLAGVSTAEKTQGKIFVQFETTVPRDISGAVNWYE